MLLRFAIGLLLMLVSLCAEQPAAVVVDGRLLWRIGASRAGFSPAARAEEIRSSIVTIASDRRRDLDDVREVHLDSESILLVGRTYVFSVTDPDAKFENKPRQELFAAHKQAALEAIRNYRDVHSFASTTRSALLGVLVLAAAFAVVSLLRRAEDLITKQALLWFRGLRDGRAGSLYRALANPLTLFVQLVLRVAFFAVKAMLAFAALSFVLRLFPATAGVAEQVHRAVVNILLSAGQSVVAYLPNLAVLVVVFVLTQLLIRLARSLALAVESGAVTVSQFHSEWAIPTYDLVRILLVLFALVVAFPYLPGGESPALKGASIFIGVLVSLGSGSAMGNVIAGIILTYMRPFRIGDRVQISDAVGDVVEKSLLVTRVRTIQHADIIIPNSAVLGNHIINYSSNARDRGLILHTTITIGYDVPWRTVHQLLIQAALRTEHILPDPKPYVYQTSLNDFHVSYEINAFTAEANRMAGIYAELHAHIQDEFNAGGVEIMSPTFLALRDGNAVTTPDGKAAEIRGI